MKKIFLSLIVCIILSSTVYSAVVERGYTTLVTTNSTIIINENLGRKGIDLVNGSTSYAVWIATSPVSSGTIHTVGAIPIFSTVEYATWRDDYYIYKSTWYGCTLTNDATMYIMEKY